MLRKEHQTDEQYKLLEGTVSVYLLPECPTANFGPLLTGRSHSVNHCVIQFHFQIRLGS